MPTNQAIRRHVLMVTVPAVALATMTGCSPNSPGAITRAIDAINSASADITSESAQWRQTLEGLGGQLADIEGSAGNDIRDIIDQTDQDVQSLVQNSLEFAGGELNNAIDHVADETRCDAQFFFDGIHAELLYLVNNLEFWQKNGKQLAHPLHTTCWVDPSALSVYAENPGWGIKTDNLRNNGNTIYLDGYGFRSDDLPSVDLMQGKNVIRSNAAVIRYVDSYELNIDLPSYIQDVPDDATLVLHWPDDPAGTDSTAISLEKVGIANLQIVGITWSPGGQIVAGESPVWPVVTVKNTGAARSDATNLGWDPGDGGSTPDVKVPAMDPGTTQPFTLHPYQYSHAGTYTAVVQLEGSASESHSVAVETANPSTGWIHTGDDCDSIRWDIDSNVVDSSSMQFALQPERKPNSISWWKEIDIPVTGGGWRALSMLNLTDAQSVTIPLDQLDRTRQVRFWKAKFGGKHTLLKYTWDALGTTGSPAGSRLTFTWAQDSCLGETTQP